jgi:hypothetical protein
MPQLRECIRQLPGRGFCNHERGAHKAVLKGLAEDGTWRTAPAKQYPSEMCRSIGTSIVQFAMFNVHQASAGSFHELPADTAAFYTPLDPYNADQVFGNYGQDFAFGEGKPGKKGRKAPPKPKVPADGSIVIPVPSSSATGRVAAAASSAANDTLSSGLPIAVLSLSDEQIDRMARNRARALEIRNERRLLWLHTHAELSHVSASPDNIDPVVRTIQNIRSGASLRRRFAFGKVKPADALAAMRPVLPHPGAVQRVDDMGLFFENESGVRDGSFPDQP